jgi:ATP-dependent DNA helicase RecG
MRIHRNVKRQAKAGILRCARPAQLPMPATRKKSGPPKSLRTADRLARLGLSTDMALVLHLPMRYEDETTLHPISEAARFYGHTVQIEGVVTRCDVQYRPRRQLVVTLADDTEQLTLRFLNFYGSQATQMAVGKRLRVRGEMREGFFGLEMVHPAVRSVELDAPLPDALTPVYPAGEGLSQTLLRKAITAAMTRVDITDTLPDALREKLSLMPFDAAVQLLHHPPSDVDENALIERSHPAWTRMKFDELLAQQLSMKRAQAARRQQGAPMLAGAGPLTAQLCKTLPFSLTSAQQRVLEEIRTDLAAPYPMQRLLQGDVGSGKTVVAALAATQAIDHQYQTALMAPTEILAEQHFRKIASWLAPLGVSTVWLTGSLKKREKEDARAKIENGSAQLIIGTHALIQQDVDFARLGLVIVDEQHRFGVAQRLTLRNKGLASVPHQLMMSATPIPRTLAMTYFADLEVSVIDELPPGRTPVITRLIAQERRDEVIERVHAAAKEGRQIYWVCPLIEESEALQLQTATDTYVMLTAALPDLRVGLVHGRLKPVEKQLVMEAFARGELQVLVATTVIEVGVDVPNASLMVIEHAERFGLSQLHQLRGRVGRGTDASACLLMYQGPLGPVAKQRLAIMRETSDGFEIARRDLDIRGPGEFLGARQSGQAMLRFADLEQDQWLVAQARDVAHDLLAHAPEIADAHLARWLGAKEDYLRV